MVSLKHGSKISIQDREYKVVYSAKRLLKPRVSMESRSIYIFQSDMKNLRHKRILESYLKEFAKKKISARTKILAERHGFKYKRVVVRDQSSRWGSCSSLKNINLNWRLIFAPPGVMDYVIIHELCHTVQMNHSKKFWDLVETKMPTWRKYRKWLREQGNEIEVEA